MRPVLANVSKKLAVESAPDPMVRLDAHTRDSLAPTIELASSTKGLPLLRSLGPSRSRSLPSQKGNPGVEASGPSLLLLFTAINRSKTQPGGFGALPLVASGPSTLLISSASPYSCVGRGSPH